MTFLSIHMEATEEHLFKVEVQGLDSFVAEHGAPARIALMTLFTEIAERLMDSQATHFPPSETIQ